MLLKEDDGSKHSYDIAEADHGVSHAEWEVLDNIHPQNATCSIAEATAAKLPIRKQSSEIVPRVAVSVSYGFQEDIGGGVGLSIHAQDVPEGVGDG